jgi:hypothetical protein
LTVGRINLSLVDDRIAGDVGYYLGPAPSEINMRVPDKVLKCVGFIAHETPGRITYGATGFIVSMKDDGLEYEFYYFVTAKHVAEKIEHGPFIVGVNDLQGKATTLRGGDLQWWYHPTEADHVDVAVTPFNAPPDKIDIKAVRNIMFATKQEIAKYFVGVGDEVSIVGLFTRFHGAASYSPIVRIGNIAMMPADPLPTENFGPMEAYLVESRSIGGLSGSPVFVRHTVFNRSKDEHGDLLTMFGVGSMHFLGLMHGHWELPLDFVNTEKAEAVNLGVSIVVPAYKILEVLNQPELVEMRQKMDKELRRPNLPVADDQLGNPKSFTKEDFEAALKKASRKLSDKK